LRDVPFFTNETIFDELHSKPGSLIVLGGGPIGCELGQMLSRLGVRVTILQRGTQILEKEDRDVAEFMQKRLEAEGVKIMLGAKPCRVQKFGVRTRVELNDGQQLETDALLVSAGRVPNIEKLNLEAAGVKFSKRGVEVNAFLQTSQPHIYAAGDVAGSFQFTHTADFMARAVVRNILMPHQLLRRKADLSVVPWCTYTDPEVARVGLNEDGAKNSKIAYDLITVPLAEVDRAVCESEETGFVKVLTRKRSDRILGVTLVGAHAGDLVHEFVLAMKTKTGLGTIASTIHAYPTFAELARKAGDKYNRKRLTPLAKKIFTWLYERALREQKTK
jgi:pyruvate/2-oxoglutarate dehydrogenase complex dihydrolipoamide dehydrogenase (E3) component